MVDELDGRLLRLLDTEPRIGVLECSRRLGVARGTVQARLDRLRSRGVISSLAPQLDPAALGYPVTAFATLEIVQGRGPDVREHLARSNADLQQVIDRVVGFSGIVRASTAIAMQTPIPYRVMPLVRRDTAPLSCA
jgi:DNA-binding Lrp family transcriptional regulator